MTRFPATFAIPCRDAGPHLRPLLESLLAQTRQDFALLLVDDGSRDGSAEVARAVAGERIEIHRNRAPLGMGANWNRCAELVRTPYFCLAHQDDRYADRYLERMLAALERHPETGLAHCKAWTLDPEGRRGLGRAERYKERFWARDPGPDPGAHFALLLRGNYVICPSVLYRTDVFRAAGGFRTDLRFALDWELWFRLLGMGHAPRGVPERLLGYRRHAASATAEAGAGVARWSEEQAVLEGAIALGRARGWLPAGRPPLQALRNSVLHEFGVAVARGDSGGAETALRFLRERVPALLLDPMVRVATRLARLGPPGRAALRLLHALAVRV
ncbi:MAG: glycosyltransferase [Planctomycetes bacterium]|nr:glycosyltransferase [Planctomycetota bacterium]